MKPVHYIIELKEGIYLGYYPIVFGDYYPERNIEDAVKYISLKRAKEDAKEWNGRVLACYRKYKPIEEDE